MPIKPSTEEIARAAALIRASRLVAFPTETVYGLGANAIDAEAVARIYAVKRRPATSPLIVHVASIEMAKSLVAHWPETAERLAQKFWPGPLTLVLPAVHVETRAETGLHVGTDAETRPGSVEARVNAKTAAFGAALGELADPSLTRSSAIAIPAIVTAGLDTVGLRMPAHPVAIALIQAAGVPLAAPSANRFTQLSPTTAEHVRRGLGDDVDCILDGGACTIGIESTVLSLAGPHPILLRPGGISRTELESVIGPIASVQEAFGDEVPGGAHPSPGMHARHYSPRTSLLLVSNGELPEKGKGIYLRYKNPATHEADQSAHMSFAKRPSDDSSTRSRVQVIQMPLPAAEYAAALYEKLHQADEANVDWIAVDITPPTPEWEAVQDRLRRAATNK
ncbi:MAG: L-threonylcarbamoyladenylate synthase [Terriglobales bacterium]